jgi:hypothetical protein
MPAPWLIVAYVALINIFCSAGKLEMALEMGNCFDFVLFKKDTHNGSLSVSLK